MKDLITRFGDFADQMESLFNALIPFKDRQLESLKAQKKEELEKLSAWYDDRMKDVAEELSILREHQKSMEPSAAPQPGLVDNDATFIDPIAFKGAETHSMDDTK